MKRTPSALEAAPVKDATPAAPHSVPERAVALETGDTRPRSISVPIRTSVSDPAPAAYLRVDGTEAGRQVAALVQGPAEGDPATGGPGPTTTPTTAPTAVPRRTDRRARMADALLTFGAIVGVLCVLLAVAAYAFQIHLVVFRTGSMSPAIDTGALSVSRTVQADDLEVGDVVTVRSATGQRITHRIQDLLRTDDGVRLTLRGDANSVDDAQPYDVTEADRVVFSVPRAGYVVAWLSGPMGIFGGGLLVGLTLLIAFGRGTGPTPDGTARGVSGITAAALVLGLGVSVASVANHRDTLASWTNAGTATSGTLATGSYGPPVAPVITSCEGGGGSDLDLTWTWPTAANGSNPSGGFEVRYLSFPGKAAVPLAGNLRSASISGHNNTIGYVSIVAITAGGTSVESARYLFYGNGSNRVCYAD